MTRFSDWKKPEIIHGLPTIYGWIVSHPQNFHLEPNTDIGAFTYIQAQYGVTICEGAQIGANCSIYSNNTIDNTFGSVIIHEDACIGANTVIFPNIVIGAGAVIGAGSIVKGSVPAGSVIIGVWTKKNYEENI